MFQVDVTFLIPERLRKTAADKIVDIVAEQADKLLGKGASSKIRKLRSDAAFQQAFTEGLQRAVDRFAKEYAVEDEDLVAALLKDKTLFDDKNLQKALLDVIANPEAFSQEKRETVLQSFDSILPDRLNRERVNRALNFFLSCLAREVWILPELRPIYELQFQKATAEAANKLVTLQEAQVQATMAMGAEIRGALLQLTDAIVEQKLLSSGDPVREFPPDIPVQHNLPQPDYERFVGGEQELAKIHQLLHPDSRHFVVTIDGIGGIGKSALALEVAYHYVNRYDKLEEQEHFDAIVWVSAKETTLTGSGPLRRSRPLSVLADIYIAIAITLQREDIIRAKVEEQDELVRQVLRQRRLLLIVDNLETVDDERVISFIREIPVPTKVIVTTRYRLDIAYPIRLAAISEPDGLLLIENEARQRNVDLTSEEARHLYHHTGGVPLAIVWSLGQISFGYLVSRVLNHLKHPTNDIARHCFEESLEFIRDRPAHKLLMALSLFETDASREALDFITNLPEEDRDDGLVLLEKLSLVDRSGSRFKMLPMTRYYSRFEIERESDLKHTYDERWLTFLLKLLGKPRETHYDILEKFQLEHQNVLAAIDFCWQTNKLESLISFSERVDFYLEATGNWMAWEKYILLGLEAATLIGDQVSRVNLQYSLAKLRDYQGDIDASLDLLDKSQELYSLQEDRDGLTTAMWWAGSIYIQQGEYEVARKILNEVMEIAEKLERSALIKSRVQRQLAIIDMASGDYDVAEARLKQTLEDREHYTRDLSLGLSLIYRSLGKLYFLKQQYELARQYYQKCLEIEQLIKTPQGSTKTTVCIAELELSLGNVERAQILARQASAELSRLGEKGCFDIAQAIINGKLPKEFLQAII